MTVLKDTNSGEIKIAKNHFGTTYRPKNKNILPNYEGEFLNNVQSGYCKIIWQNGRTYKGFISNNKMNGKGVLRYEDGSIYEGLWKDDQKKWARNIY